MLLLGHKGCLGRLIGLVLKLVLGVVVLAAAVVGACNYAVIHTSEKNIVSLQSASDYNADAIVVLGASVFEDGTPSTILKDRLDDAVLLYGENAAPKIIVSGDNGDASYNESAAMKQYLVSQGIPSEDIFCDYAGFSTYETMYRAKNVFGCSKVVVATQTYHLYRAVYDARGVGMDAIGVASDYHTYQQQDWYNVREVAARVQDVVLTFLKVPSTFVGDAISLDGSGDDVA